MHNANCSYDATKRVLMVSSEHGISYDTKINCESCYVFLVYKNKLYKNNGFKGLKL